MTKKGPENPVSAIRDAIETADVVRDSFEALVDRTRSNPGAPFETESLAQLAYLKEESAAAYETVRALLKEAGCRVSKLDKAVERIYRERDREPKQSDVLVDFAASVELFHAHDGTA